MTELLWVTGWPVRVVHVNDRCAALRRGVSLRMARGIERDARRCRVCSR